MSGGILLFVGCVCVFLRFCLWVCLWGFAWLVCVCVRFWICDRFFACEIHIVCMTGSFVGFLGDFLLVKSNLTRGRGVLLDFGELFFARNPKWRETGEFGWISGSFFC